MATLEQWVGDRLHDILGISDKVIAQFLISLAGKSNSLHDYTEKLEETGAVEMDDRMTQFSAELWNKVSWF